MLNLFAATGRTTYAKSATHPWLYAQYMNGHHTVQRTPQNGTGIWTDEVTEQTLIRSIKSRGTLTGGRGMTKSVSHALVLSFSHVAMIHNAMVQITCAANKSSEQHQEVGRSRTNQDYHESLKFSWLPGSQESFPYSTYIRYQLKEMILIVRKLKMLAELSRLH